MIFQKAHSNDFERIKSFYWDLIDEMQDQNDVIGWKKGIYPTDEFLQESLLRGELFTLEEDGQLYACTVLNSESNEGYAGTPWSLNCRDDEVLIPHALGVRPAQQGKGVGQRVVEEILQYARVNGKKAVRLDILGQNAVAEKLYTKCGIQFVQAKTMFYEDTGWTEFKMYEFNL